ncbi:MAG: malate:quinone oxidoreductase [Prochlorococcus sp.]
MSNSAVVGSEDHFDAVLVGAGIMGTTLATLLHELDPSLRLLIVERLAQPALESSGAANNAGTGHAANCELNYTPQQPDGTIAISKALEINNSFESSLEFWASLTELGKLDPRVFLHQLPQISAVWGEADAGFLRQRHAQLSALPAFEGMEWSDDPLVLAEWMPLVMEGRPSDQVVAATRMQRGTDVDFGALTHAYLSPLQASGALELRLGTEVKNLKRLHSAASSKVGWQLNLQGANGASRVVTPFVFLGAGGGALPLLQRSGIPEARAYAGFPVSGQWLVCSEQHLVERHFAKVYGKAKLGAPPMSVPHLDSRWINGQKALLFGPYAGFSSKFLKQGSLLDLPRSLRPANLLPMLQVGLNNANLVSYLINQLRQSHADRLACLREFFPRAQSKDWSLDVAGQRVQIIKRTPEGGRLQLGTEVVASADGSLAALLGASPGASTAVSIMLEVLQRCWGERLATAAWQQRLKQLLPSFGLNTSTDPSQCRARRERSDALLQLRS